MVHFTKAVAALLILTALALGIYAWMLGQRKPPAQAALASPAASDEVRPAIAQYPVVVTTRATPAGQPIAADALRIAQLPIQPAGTYASVEDVAGRVPVFDLSEGMPLVQNQLAAGLAQRLGSGERAVAVRADEAMGVGNRVQPGDFVDVFVVLKSDGKDIERNQARLLLTRKRVLAFGSASVENTPSRPTESTRSAEAARTVVLAIPVTEISRLALAENGGQLLLALRNPGDTEPLEPAVYAGLSASHFAMVPTPKNVAPVQAVQAVRTAQPRRASMPNPPRVNEVEFIRGDRRETLTY